MIKGITIHNTGNDLSAKEIYKRLVENKNYNICHYLVDEEEVVMTQPISEVAFHTGKGYDFGNLYTVAIEICRSTSDLDLYLKAQRKAIDLIKKLMKEYHFTKDDIYFHRDFDREATCPHRILEIYETKERFINECIL